jgi:hypothetical protein
MLELIFEVTQEADGGFFAECLTESIVTEADTWDQLRHNVKEVVRAFYFDQLDKLPTTIRLHLVKDEVLAYAWNFRGTLLVVLGVNADTKQARKRLSKEFAARRKAGLPIKGSPPSKRGNRWKGAVSRPRSWTSRLFVPWAS